MYVVWHSQTPKREARGSGCKPILSFVLTAEILQSNQITEQLIMTPIIANYEYQHPVAMWTCDGNCKHYRNRSVREAARSAARELGYRDLKSEQLKVVETFV